MRHLLRRILFYLVAAWAAITLNFIIPRLAPGDPALSLLGRIQRQGGQVTPATLQALRAMLGVDTNDPLWLQYVKYLNALLHGNMGVSITYFPTPVMDIIGQSIIWTIGLGIIALTISCLLGWVLGIVMAWKRGSLFDTMMSPGMTFLYGVPYFWAALLLLYVFGFVLGWFPLSQGYDVINLDPGWTPDFIGSVIQHGILPAASIVVVSVGGWMLLMRNTMIATLSEDYVLMAEAKGLRSRRVLFMYAARNAILPNLASFAISLGFLVSGQLLTEIVFSYPGIGYELLKAIESLDYALMQAIFLFITLAVLGANFLADLAYSLLDPRVRQERSV
jgi:peptide/nickel transport system permease protein